MITSSLRRALSAVACVVLLAGCSTTTADGAREPEPQPGRSAAGGTGGDGGSGADPLSLVRSVSRNVRDAGSYRATFRIAIEAQGQRITASGEGEFSNDPLQAHVDYRFEGMPVGVGGPGGAMQMEMILDGTVMYLRAPAMLRAPMIDTAWISMDLEEFAPGFGDLAELSQGQNDPSTAIEYLRGIEDVETVGREDVAGLATTHYVGIVDLDSASNRLPADAGPELQEALAQAKQRFGARMPVDVWIDDDGMLRRMSFTMAGSPSALSMEMTIEIAEYGIVLDLPIPPASQVTDLSELAGMTGGAGGWS